MAHLEFLRPGRRRHAAELPGCASAFALAELAARHRVLAVMHDEASARRLHEYLASLNASSHLITGWEMLPYDAASPPRSAVCARCLALANLHEGLPGIYAISASSLMLPTAPPERSRSRWNKIELGMAIDLASLRAELADLGCFAVDRVRSSGEYANYGGQVDVFPGGSRHPYRLVFDDDCLEQIRIFDVATQRSIERVPSIQLRPARDYPLDSAAITSFRNAWREHIPANACEQIYETISSGAEAEGAEFLLPLFYGGARYSVLDYLRSDDCIWLGINTGAALIEFAELAEERYDEACRTDRPALPPADVFASAAELDEACRTRRVIEHGMTGISCGFERLPNLATQPASTQPHARLISWLKNWTGKAVVVAREATRRKGMLAEFAANDIKPIEIEQFSEADQPGIYLLDSSLSGGFIDQAQNLALITEAERYDWRPADPVLTAAAAAAAYEDLVGLDIGELVVSEQHGIGRFLGLTTLEDNGREQEFIAIEYEGSAKLYVEIAHCHEITRYRQPEPGEEIKLDRLGGKRWSRVRKRAQQAAADAAAGLLEIYAARERTGARDPVGIHEQEYSSFCAGFAHAETVCQTRATAEVLGDMTANYPMDRLVCGDVGFGKTEVAMRAAWAAWACGNQVAVITPTTLLAEQHYRTFAERFANTDAYICLHTARGSPARHAMVLEQLASGQSLIVIGTHALLSSKVKIPQLSLAIIDEEHRFGVRHKERVKQLRSSVDVLALSATPIPRSLAMALDGLRDLSLMATPPPGRLAVRTFAGKDSDSTVREALARELARGGQAFCLHHRISTMNAAMDRMRCLAPGARIAAVHARLPQAEIDAAMRGFYAGEIDVLVCSTVIESGIDVPNANTIVVTHAERYGLAQMHQLRGRVGRAGRQAYAYFLASHDGIGEVARARIKTVAAASELGSGHIIARRDLEIRGAGELLGIAQSGAVADVGIDAFRSMIKRASKLQLGKRIAKDASVDLGSSACLPADYCPSPVERMRLYSLFAAATEIADIEKLRELLNDRFGRLPAAARLMVSVNRLRVRAGKLGIRKINSTASGLILSFEDRPPCEEAVLALVVHRPDCRLRPNGELHIDYDADAFGLAALAFELLDSLEDTAQMKVAAAG